MTNDTPNVNSTFAGLKNMALLLSLAKKLANRGPHMPGFGVFYGPSGFGKTIASIYTQNKTDALRIEIGDSWTKKKLLTAMLMELGVNSPRGTISGLTDQVIDLLARYPDQPIIIDEADKLVEKNMVEIVREIQEYSGAPVILLGEELFPSKLENNERAHNRVLDWVGAQPCDLTDTQELARLYCPEIELAEDLAERIRQETHGRARRIVTTLESVRHFAINEGLHQVSANQYTGKIISGASPQGRRLGK